MVANTSEQTINISEQWKNNGHNEKISQHDTAYNGSRFSATMIHNKERPNSIKVEVSGGQNLEHRNISLPIIDFVINIPNEHFDKYYSNPNSILKLDQETMEGLGIKTSNFISRTVNSRFNQELENVHHVFPVAAPKTDPASQTASISTHREENLFSTGHYIG